MFKLLRYIVSLKWRINRLESRIEQLEYRGRPNPKHVNPYDLNSHGGFRNKYIVK